MTQITERPAERTTGFPTAPQHLVDEVSETIKAVQHSDLQSGTELLVKLAVLISDPDANRAEIASLFYRDNAGGRDTLGSLFYGSSESDEDTGPIVAPSSSRVMDLGYRTALVKLHAALNALLPADTDSLDEKRDFWEDVKTHLAPGQAMDDGQVSEVTSADLNTVLKAHYGSARVRKLTAYTDHPESLNFALFNPRTVENTKLEVRASFRLFGEEPPVGAFSLRTINGIVHFI